MRTWPILVALTTLCGCGGAGDTNNPAFPTRGRVPTAAEVERATKSLAGGPAAKVPAASNELGFRLFAEIVKKEPEKNAFVSPASVSIALAMAYNGSAGTTREAMEKTLGLSGVQLPQVNEAYKSLRTVLASPDAKVRLDIANSLWAKSGVEFKRDFLGRIQDYFDAKPTSLDFAAPDSVKTINDWVSQATQEKIKSIVDKIEPDSVMFLINAVYFKGAWSEPFDPKLSSDREFTPFDGKKRDVPMMSRRDRYEYYAGDKFQAVRLPYGAGRLAMLAFLPDAGSSFKDFLKGLNAKNWQAWTSKFKKVDGTVILPKFRLEYEAVLNPFLSQLGMEVAFDSKSANFTGMREQQDLFLQRVLHKTFVEVNEEGTEASAVTSVEVGVTSAPAPEKSFEFLANRPFAYAIADKETGIILFLGIMGDPK